MTTSKTNGRGRAAIVTGAARRIGRDVAHALHRRGVNVLIHCRDSIDGARELAAQLEAERAGSALVVAADLAEKDSPERLVAAALDAFGRLDVLVNNASSFQPSPLDQATVEDWEELMASNLKGPFFLSCAAAPHLARDHGAIVNLADIHGLVPLKNHAVYSQAKAGLIMQTRALAKDLAPEIRVNAVAPGTVLWPEGEEAPSKATREAILARVPLGRQGTPGDIAGAVVYLALDAPYVTGQVLVVDGGRTLYM